MVHIANITVKQCSRAVASFRFPFTVEKSLSYAATAIAANMGQHDSHDSGSDNKQYYYSDFDEIYVPQEPSEP